eukprot:gene3780-4704_t
MTSRLGRREAIRLYRDILRTVRLFPHTNEQGIPWRVVLRDSARNEFESHRYETDSEKILEMLMVGRDCLMKIQDGMISGKVDKNPEPAGGSPFTKIT